LNDGYKRSRQEHQGILYKSDDKVDPFEVGWLFVQEYYTFLNKDPSKLHCFYNKKSSFLHGHEGESAKVCHGQSVTHLFNFIQRKFITESWN
jgi:hypothetical protein